MVRLRNPCRVEILILVQGPRILVTRHHQHYVPSHKDYSFAVRAFEAWIHQRNRLHAYAHTERSADIPAIEWLCGKAVQNQHETTTVRITNMTKLMAGSMIYQFTPKDARSARRLAMDIHVGESATEAAYELTTMWQGNTSLPVAWAYYDWLQSCRRNTRNICLWVAWGGIGSGMRKDAPTTWLRHEDQCAWAKKWEFGLWFPGRDKDRTNERLMICWGRPQPGFWGTADWK